MVWNQQANAELYPIRNEYYPEKLNAHSQKDQRMDEYERQHDSIF